MTRRYKAMPVITRRGYPVYAVVDTKTEPNVTLAKYECSLWAERKAAELNREEDAKAEKPIVTVTKRRYVRK